MNEESINDMIEFKLIRRSVYIVGAFAVSVFAAIAIIPLSF